MQAQARPQSSNGNTELSSSRPRSENDVHYTAFVRLPFPRGDFVDPPLVDWDAAQDRALWKILSDNPRSAVIDWNELARQFEVTLPFILQQAAWLYERQLSLVREQMRKFGRPIPTLSSQTVESAGTRTAQPMQRLDSQGGIKFSFGSFKGSPIGSTARPTPSMTPDLRDRPSSLGNEGLLGEGTSGKPKFSRTTSATTITQSQLDPPIPEGPQARSTHKASRQPGSQAEPSTPYESTQRRNSSPPLASSSSSSSSTSSSAASGSRYQNIRSQVLRRPPRFASARVSRGRNAPISFLGDEDDDEDEEGSPFLPFAATADDQRRFSTMGAVSRNPTEGSTLSRAESAISEAKSSTQPTNTTSSLSSVASSAVPMSAAARGTVLGGVARQVSRPPNMGYRAELVGLGSPHRRSLGLGQSSDGTGTPSMGSSFSDLDDASVTQSALEEALMSNMQRGGMGSRISNISQAPRYAG